MKFGGGIDFMNYVMWIDEYMILRTPAREL